MEIKKNTELLKAEKHFANHKARLDILDDHLSILNWKQPGMQAYAFRAVMDGYHVYLSGDLGAAVIRLTEPATLKALSGYWKSPEYFMEKIVCTTDDYVFDYRAAKDELRERKNSLMKEYRDNHPDMLANGETEYQCDLDDAEGNLLADFNAERGFGANAASLFDWLELDADGDETVPYMGRKIVERIWLWLAAFEMAYQELMNTEEKES